MDTSELLKAYARTKIRESVESVEIEPYKTPIPLPSIHGIKDALITVVSYAECRIGIQKCLCGLLDRRGNVILPPEYKDIYGWNEHEVKVKGNNGYSKTIEL